MTTKNCWPGTLVLWGCFAAAAAAEEDYLPGTFKLAPPVDLYLEQVQVEVPDRFKEIVGKQRTLNLPPNFRATVFAAPGLNNPRFMAFGPDGVLYLANMGGGQILALPDQDEDGVADSYRVVADGFKEAHSLAFYKGDMYVADTHQVVRLWDADRDGDYEEREVFIDSIPSEGWHTTRTIVFDERNEKIYLSVGSPCDLCRDGEARIGYSGPPVTPSQEWGTILQFNADGTGRRVFARGIRNVVGMDLHPVTNELWGDHNHFDLGGSELPPEWIDIIRDGDFMGFPFAYGYQVYVDSSIGGVKQLLPFTREDSLRVGRMKRPVALVPAHLAPLGLHFYRGESFPKIYRNMAFVALHGGKIGGNLASVPGFKVVAVFSEPDGSNARVGDFLSGFYTDPGGEDIWGKPVGLATDAAGNLYISSNHAPYTILRIEYAYTSVEGSWLQSLPDSLLSGEGRRVEALVRLDRFDPAGGRPRLFADLSALGGPAALPLVAVDDSTYRLETTLKIDIPNGYRSIVIRMEQDTPEGVYTNKLVQRMVILPTQDLVVFADSLAAGWQVEHSSRITLKSTAEQLELQARTGGLAGWSAQLSTAAPVEPRGYKALRFAFHPGDLQVPEGGQLSVEINRPTKAVFEGYGQYGNLPVRVELPDVVNLKLKEWQVVEIPLDGVNGPIELIRFFGNAGGTFYLDDMRLVTAAQPGAVTAVAEEQAALPAALTLEQNKPNPFNGATAIHYALPASGEVELAVYNLAGQRVAVLVEGVRAAGIYTVRWDGRNGQGQELASGVYLYRLRAGEQVETRKLSLVR